MKKQILFAALVLILGAIALLIVLAGPHQQAPVLQDTTSYLDSTYTVEGVPVALVHGVATSTESVVTREFGGGALADINGDSKNDAALILVQSPGGSGTFYYAAAALGNGTGYTGTNAILLGDRIAPQTMQIKDGRMIVNYAERKPSEPMTTQPSVGVSRYFKIVGPNLVETTSTDSADSSPAAE